MSITPIIIIGAGPAGLSAAIEAIKRGYKAENILILERSNEIAAMISKKYPDEKPIFANYKGRLAECLGDLCIIDMSKADFFDYLHSTIKQFKLRINFHQDVKKIVKLKNGQLRLSTQNEEYVCNAIFIAIGNMASPRNLEVLMSDEVLQKLSYDIENINLSKKKILVVGGGDSAAEYSKILSDRGHSVFLSYRNDEFLRMTNHNRDTILKCISDKTITYFPKTTIHKLIESNNQVEVYFNEDPLTNIRVDHIVVALGAERPNNYLNSIGIQTENENGDFFSESKIQALYFVGDLVAAKSGGSINFAFNSGVKAVTHACEMHLDCPIPQKTVKLE